MAGDILSVSQDGGAEGPENPPDIIETWASILMVETLRHRGSYGRQLVAQFCAAVEKEMERFKLKGLDETTMQTIRETAERAQAKARARGVLAYFDTEA